MIRWAFVLYALSASGLGKATPGGERYHWSRCSRFSCGVRSDHFFSRTSVDNPASPSPASGAGASSGGPASAHARLQPASDATIPPRWRGLRLSYRLALRPVTGLNGLFAAPGLLAPPPSDVGVLAAGPDGLALLGEGADALARVIRAVDARPPGVGAVVRLRQRKVETHHRRLLRRPHRDRRALHDLPRPALGRGHQLGQRHDLVDEAPAQRLLGGHEAAGEQVAHGNLEGHLAR